MTTNYNNKKGFTLLEVVLALSIIGLVLLLDVISSFRDLEQRSARQTGTEIFTVSKALSDFMSFKIGDDTYSGGTYTTLQFLKDPENTGDCQTAEIRFISCSYLPGDRLTMSDIGFSIIVEKRTSVDDAGFENNILHSKIVFDRIMGRTNVDEQEMVQLSMSGLATLVAKGAVQVGSYSPAGKGMYPVIQFCIQPLASICEPSDDGHIIAEVSGDAMSQQWLRIDHGNTMQAEVEFNDSLMPSQRMVVNVARMFNEIFGGSRNEAMILGHGGYYTRDNFNVDYGTGDIGVVVDGDYLAYQDMYVRLDAGIKEDVEIGTFAQVNGEMSVDGDTNLELELEVQGDSRIRSNMDIEETTNVKKNLYSDDFETNELEVSGKSDFFGLTYAESNLDQYGTSKDAMVEQRLYLPQFIDMDSSSYYMDPSDQSKFYRLTITDQLELPVDTKLVINSNSNESYHLYQGFPEWVNKGHYVFQNGQAGKQNIPKPVCPNGGTPEVGIIPMAAEYNLSSGDYLNGNSGNRGAWSVHTNDLGGSWDVSVVSQGTTYKDVNIGNDGLSLGGTHDYQAAWYGGGLVRTYCHYEGYHQ